MKPFHIIRIIVFSFIALVLVVFTMAVLDVPYDHDAIGVYSFYMEPQDSIDVIFIGPSDVYCSVYSPLCYEKQGFTSYSLSVASMMGSEYQSAVELVEERQNPQLYVVDMWGFSYSYQHNETSIRKWVDSLPYSAFRLKAINELITDEDERSDYYIKFVKYHSKWDYASECIGVFKEKIDLNTLGYSITKRFVPALTVMEGEGPEEEYAFYESGMDYLDEFLDFLKEQGIENVLFCDIPYCFNEIYTDSYDAAVQKVKDAGYTYVNFGLLKDSIGLDRSDFANAYHMNVFGAWKFSEYISGYIMENYDINTDHSEEITKEWDSCAQFNEQVFSHLGELTLIGSDDSIYRQKDLLGESISDIKKKLN